MRSPSNFFSRPPKKCIRWPNTRPYSSPSLQKREANVSGAAKKQLIRLLSRRELSSAQALKKLLERDIPEDDAQAAIAWCVEADYINDRRWAEGRVRALVRKKKSNLFIRQKLEPGRALPRAHPRGPPPRGGPSRGAPPPPRGPRSKRSQHKTENHSIPSA